jgi:diguanylate cyclase (GGDEF)-like protein/PAS domain S-box-containing protein
MAEDRKSQSEQSQTLLESLNSVVASLQLSILSEDDVYRAFSKGIARMGLRGGISILDETGESLVFRALGYPKPVLNALNRLEKLAGISAARFSVKVKNVEVYRRVIEERATVFAPNSSKVIGQILGGMASRIIERVSSTFSDVPVIYAPLVVRERMLGIVNIAGADLTRDDIFSIEALALQLSIALDNARLLSALQTSEETYRTLINTSPEAVTMTDLDGIITFVSPQTLILHGASSPEELIGKSAVDLIAPDERGKAMANLEVTLEHGVARSVEYTLLRTDGSTFIGEMNAAMIKGADGEPTAFIGTTRDITERKRLEQVYHGLVNQALMGFVVGQNDRIVFANSAFLAMSGYSFDELLQMSPKQVQAMVHPKDRVKVWRDFQKQLAGNEIEPRCEFRGIRKDGSQGWFEMIASLTDYDGRLAIQAAVLDITDRVLAKEVIEESEEKLRDIYTNVTDILYYHDLDGNFIEANLFYKEEMGYTEEEIRRLGVRGLIPERYRHEYDEYIKELVKAGRSQGLMRVVAKNGNEHILEYRNTLVRDETGPIGVRGSARDITERLLIERDLRESEERYRTLVENVRVGVYRSTGEGEGRFLHANPAMAEIFGFDSVKEFMRASVVELYLDPKERKVFLEEVMARGSVKDREIQLKRKDGTTFWGSVNASATFDAQGGVEWLDGVIEDVTERKKAEERLLHDAFFDGLTGLPNRALLLDRLDRVIARSKRREDYHCAVLFMDLDRFKVVNDSLGHSVGDKLLISVAGRLHECLRSEDTVARLGGDEFVVLLEDLKELSQATSIADRIREELSRPHDLNGQKVFTSGSIGIVMTVQGYNQPADVLRDADIAMYGAKLAGKDRYQIFDPAMRELALTRMQLEVELRQALAREELRVHFQPILEMDSGKPFGFEALIRWEHPQRGIISPAEFLPILEETGLIIQAGRWVMKEACKTARQWNRKHSDLEPLTISVNLSGREFTHPELEDSLKEALEESELDPACLTVEITESVIMSDPEQARHVLQRLGSLGLQIHLDDFGTGYSSLGKLGQFHIDKLKIDRTFIRQIEGKRGEAAIVEAILQLARNLAMGVIAEGVETQQQFNYLREKGCPYYQGYYIAEPMSKPEAEAFIRAKKKELKRNKGR